MPESLTPRLFLSSHWLGILVGALAMWSLIVFSRKPLYERGGTDPPQTARADALGMVWRFGVILLVAVIIALLEESRTVSSLPSAALIGALMMVLPSGYHIGQASKAGTVRSDIAHIVLSAVGGIVCASAIYLLRVVS